MSKDQDDKIQDSKEEIEEKQKELIIEAIPGLTEASKKRIGYRKILLKYIRENIELYPDNHTKKLLSKRITRGQLSNLSDSDLSVHAQIIFDVKEGVKPDE